jgi:hypothetical protein
MPVKAILSACYFDNVDVQCQEVTSEKLTITCRTPKSRRRTANSKDFMYDEKAKRHRVGLGVYGSTLLRVHVPTCAYIIRDNLNKNHWAEALNTSDSVNETRVRTV